MMREDRKIKIDGDVRRLSRLISIDENLILKELNKCEKTISDYNWHGEDYVKRKSTKQIIKLYKSYCNAYKNYLEKIDSCSVRKSKEREWDIVDTLNIIKFKSSFFKEYSSRRIKIDVDDTVIAKLKHQSRLYHIHKKSDKPLHSNSELKFFCAIPEGYKCNLYCNNELRALVVIANHFVSVHRNGSVSRDVINIEWMEAKEEKKQQENDKKKKNISKNVTKSIDNISDKQSKKHIAITEEEQNKLSEKMNCNEVVIALRNRERRVSFSGVKTEDSFSCFSKVNAVKRIQLIRGMRNHVTLGHSIENRTASFVYYDSKIGKYVGIKILLHYCNNCKCYFDFYNSFLGQLRMEGLTRNGLLVRYFDEYDNEMFFDNISLREHSRLNLFGYKAGYSGLSQERRQILLTRLIDEKYMSPAEIKNHLEFLINFRGKEKKMAYCKQCWEEDIAYINQLIKDNSF